MLSNWIWGDWDMENSISSMAGVFQWFLFIYIKKPTEAFIGENCLQSFWFYSSQKPEQKDRRGTSERPNVAGCYNTN